MGCYCHTCEKPFHPLGVMMHRKAHLNRGETCVIEYTHGDTFTHAPDQPNIKGKAMEANDSEREALSACKECGSAPVNFNGDITPHWQVCPKAGCAAALYIRSPEDWNRHNAPQQARAALAPVDGAVEVCRECDIAGCRHIRERKAAMPDRVQPDVEKEQSDRNWEETDGCPTEMAVLKRFWREHRPLSEDAAVEIIRKSVSVQTKPDGPIAGLMRDAYRALLAAQQPKPEVL